MREFKADDVIFEVIVSRVGWKLERRAPGPGSISQLSQRTGGGGWWEEKKRKNYLKRRKSAVGHFAVRRSISTQRVCMFLADSRDAVSLHKTIFSFFFYPFFFPLSRKILCVFTDFSKRMPFRTAVELQRSIYCRR